MPPLLPGSAAIHIGGNSCDHAHKAILALSLSGRILSGSIGVGGTGFATSFVNKLLSYQRGRPWLKLAPVGESVFTKTILLMGQ